YLASRIPAGDFRVPSSDAVGTALGTATDVIAQARPDGSGTDQVVEEAGSADEAVADVIEFPTPDK
ncbi:MAG: hypothetical protein M9942_14005, partial [Microthrixaceae bacterium]|nr:hypothetical protein [Microthrixaceae bacterium]